MVELDARGRDLVSAEEASRMLRDMLPIARSTAWMQCVSSVLAGSVRVAEALAAGHPCKVSCSDGWDRTAQLSGLAQVLVDPYCRTVVGFMEVIDREFRAWGHQLARRHGIGCGHVRSKASDSQRAPIILQLLDCAWQMGRQLPHAFEFNENLLALLAREAYAGRSGSWLHDREQQRFAAGTVGSTMHVWSVVAADPRPYLNRGYDIPSPGLHGGALAGGGRDGDGDGGAEGSGLEGAEARARELHEAAVEAQLGWLEGSGSARRARRSMEASARHAAELLHVGGGVVEQGRRIDPRPRALGLWPLWLRMWVWH